MTHRTTDLRNFVAAAAAPTLSQAARRLAITQPALSESIKRLEASLDVVLFYRSRAGIRLTPSGRVVLSRAQRALQALREVEIGADAAAPFAGRTITVGCHPIVAQYTLPAALSELARLASDYRIELRHNLSRTIQLEIQRGNIDVGIVVNPTPVPDLVIRRLAIDHVRVWAKDARRRLDTVICDPLLTQTQSILKRWKRRPGRVLSSESLELVAQLTARGLGYGILPERAVRILRSDLARVDKLPSFRDEIALVHRPEMGKVLAERMVLDALRSAFLAEGS